MNKPTHSRRALLRRGILLGASTWIGTDACSAPESPETTLDRITPEQTISPAPTGASTAPRTLLAYFSRAGENHYYGGRRHLEVGNTEVLARMIRELIDCDVHRIDAADPYPAGYDATVERNVAEQDADARPGIANPLASIGQYDVVLLGSPIWNVRAPMIMSTFTDSHDFTGKTVHPFVTYAVSGLGSIERDYAASCPERGSVRASRYEAKRFPGIGTTSRPGCVRPGSPHDPTAPASDPMNTTHPECDRRLVGT